VVSPTGEVCAVIDGACGRCREGNSVWYGRAEWEECDEGVGEGC